MCPGGRGSPLSQRREGAAEAQGSASGDVSSSLASCGKKRDILLSWRRGKVGLMRRTTSRGPRSVCKLNERILLFILSE